jgi:hypothetical protein
MSCSLEISVAGEAEDWTIKINPPAGIKFFPFKRN